MFMEVLTLNVQDVVTRVKRTFGDEAGVQITDQDIIRWINDAQNQVVLDNQGLMETSGVTDVVVNQDAYDFPSDVFSLRSLNYKGRRLKSMTLSEFDEYLDGYQANPNVYGTGTPEVFMIWENKFTVFPKPDSSVEDGFKIYYIKEPDTVGNLADSLTVPLKYHNSIVDYCLRQAYELDEDYDKASYKKSVFDENMMKLSNQNKNTTEYYPTITTLPQDENYGDYGIFGSMP